MKNPKISIIVPVYNVASYLSICIESILSQTMGNIECILVNDCSPDNSPQICNEYANKDSRIKVLHKEQNEGLPQARKSGFDISTGEYIMFVDSDDWIEPDMADKMFYKAENDKCDIIVSGVYMNNGKIQSEYYTPELFDKITIIKELILRVTYLGSVCNKMFKRAILEKVQFPINNFFEDRTILIQSIYYMENIGYLNNCLYHYRVRKGGITKSYQYNKKKLHEYANYKIIADFLFNAGLIPYLEPEFSFFINSIKLSFLENHSLRKSFNTVISNLYPKSTDYFGKKKINIMDTLLLSFALKNKKCYYLVSLMVQTFRSLKSFFKMMIPKKLRQSIRKK